MLIMSVGRQVKNVFRRLKLGTHNHLSKNSRQFRRVAIRLEGVKAGRKLFGLTLLLTLGY